MPFPSARPRCTLVRPYPRMRAPALHLTITFLLFRLLIVTDATAQVYTISGHVVDAETGAALPGVNVFISNTTLGDASGADGSFRVESVPGGRVEVVASMIGFEPQSRILDLPNHALVTVNFRLVGKRFHEEEALVTAKRPRSWRRHLERFTRELLGTSERAEDCSILNPYVLDFIDDREVGTLRAFASEPLLIENRALAYDIVFVLDDFEVSDYPYRIRYRGRPRFRERMPSSEENAHAIEQRREAAYRGSMRDFLVSLTTSTLEKNGFEAHVGPDRVSDQQDIHLLPRLEVDSVKTRGQASYETLVYVPGVLHVIYHGEPEPGKYRRFVRDVTGASRITKREQTSFLIFDHGVTIHATGYAYEPYAITTLGYWAWERLADTLPRDYRFDAD